MPGLPTIHLEPILRSLRPWVASLRVSVCSFPNPYTYNCCMQALFGDLRFGARMLIKSPGFTLAAIVTLTLGIGANAAIFTVPSALLLRPFPYHEPQQLVSLDVKNKTTNFTGTLVRYELLRDRNRSFE